MWLRSALRRSSEKFYTHPLCSTIAQHQPACGLSMPSSMGAQKGSPRADIPIRLTLHIPSLRVHFTWAGPSELNINRTESYFPGKVKIKNFQIE